MKVLVIPDVHLKPQMFKQATALLRAGAAERAVCLMDIPDDWDKQFDIALYEETYDEAIRFAKKFPETAWCYGNLINTDVFSTYRDGRPIGTEEFLLLDTLTWDYDGVKI